MISVVQASAVHLDKELIQKTAETVYDLVRVVFTSPESNIAVPCHRQFHKSRYIVCFSIIFELLSIIRTVILTDGSTFLHQVTSWWVYHILQFAAKLKSIMPIQPACFCDFVISKRTRSIDAKFHPDRIWTDRALDFFYRWLPKLPTRTQEQQDEWRHGISSWYKNVASRPECKHKHCKEEVTY